MPRLPEVKIQPPGNRDAEAYRRRFAVQVTDGFRGTRETLNQVADLEALTLELPGAVANGTYPIGILPSNRRVKRLLHGLRAGTCTARVKHGATGSEANIDWDGLSPAADVPATTTITEELPDSNEEIVEASTWVIVEILSASGANGLALTLHLT